MAKNTLKGSSETTSTQKPKKKLPRFLNIHVLLLVILILFPILIVWKYSRWVHYIDKDELNSEDIPIVPDTLDMILPLTKTDDYIDDGITTIAFFGNSPFADDRNSDDNLVNMVKDRLGAEVYNFSMKDTHMACLFDEYVYFNYPLDAYSFYWLIEALTTNLGEEFFEQASSMVDQMGDVKPEYCDEVVHELLNVDFSKVDIAVIMYDALDYLDGMAMYDDSDHFSKICFTGSLESGIVKLQEKFPNTRIIVMSPTYAYYRTEDGQYISSDIFYYKEIQGRDVLSTYSIKEGQSCALRHVTFIDNLYGTITGANADQYLLDHLHLNVEGRKLVADRLIYAIQYFDRLQNAQ